MAWRVDKYVGPSTRVPLRSEARSRGAGERHYPALGGFAASPRSLHRSLKPSARMLLLATPH